MTTYINGIKYINQASCDISNDSEIEKGAQIGPNVQIIGKCKIGKNTSISNSTLENAIIENDCNVTYSYIKDCRIGSNVEVGPFARIREGCEIARGCKIGNFVEIKSSMIGQNSKVAHHAYVGDATVGRFCNIGCGVVFANYDGEKKHKTILQDYVFVGSNCNLVAPLVVGKGAFIAAGSTVCENVSDFQFYISRAKSKMCNDTKKKYYLSALKKQKPAIKLFGTDGIRGKVGIQINTKLFKACAYAVASLFSCAKVAIASDSRPSGKLFKNIFCSALKQYAPNSTIDDFGICPTPAISQITQKGDYDLGVVITASHNTAEYNGIKFFDCNGQKISRDTQKIIEKLIADYKDEHIKIYAQKQISSDFYVNYLKAAHNTNNKEQKLLVDCANGATCRYAKKVLDDLGYNVVYVNCDENSEINKNSCCLDQALFAKHMQEHNCDIGFAFDGDGDRIVACDKNGDVVDGDKILFLLTNYFKQIHNTFDGVVCTIQSNFGLIKALENMHVCCDVSDVGDHNVLMLMNEKNAMLGGEQSGHIIIKKHSNSGDGLMCMIEILNALNYLNQSIESFQFFKPFYQQSCSIATQNKAAMCEIFKQSSTYNDAQNEIGDGRILLRASGTEDKLRLLVECNDKKKCQAVFQKLHLALCKQADQP